MFTSSIYYIGTGGLFISSTKAVQICTRSIGREVGSFITCHAHSQQDYLSSIRGTVEVTDWWLHNMTPKSDYPKVPNTFIKYAPLCTSAGTPWGVQCSPQTPTWPWPTAGRRRWWSSASPSGTCHSLCKEQTKNVDVDKSTQNRHPSYPKPETPLQSHSKFATNSAAAEALTR